MQHSLCIPIRVKPKRIGSWSKWTVHVHANDHPDTLMTAHGRAHFKARPL